MHVTVKVPSSTNCKIYFFFKTLRRRVSVLQMFFSFAVSQLHLSRHSLSYLPGYNRTSHPWQWETTFFLLLYFYQILRDFLLRGTLTAWCIPYRVSCWQNFEFSAKVWKLYIIKAGEYHWIKPITGLFARGKSKNWLSTVSENLSRPRQSPETTKYILKLGTHTFLAKIQHSSYPAKWKKKPPFLRSPRLV